jgi:uncharacterized membrane protein YjjP (DUF1212 family)
VPPQSQHSDAISFILSLGRALHGYGYAAHRLEEVLAHISWRLGLIAQFFSTPTSIMVGFGSQNDQHTYLMRVEPGDQNLGKLAQLDEIIVRVMHGELSAAEGVRRVAEVVAAPPLYGPGITVLAFGLASAASSRFFGGGWREAVVGAVIGLVIGLMAVMTGRIPGLGRVFEPLGAFVAAVLAGLAGTVLGPFSAYTATLAGIIVLIPGLTFTVAMEELSTRNLMSGTARLSGAFITFLGITFGVALGTGLVSRAFGPPAPGAPMPLPGWTLWLALVLAPLGFTVLLKALPRDAIWIVLSGIVAFAGVRIGADLLGVELGAFVAAFIVGLSSNIFARVFDRPASIPLTPGILLLVPGSIGYRSFSSLLEREVVLGIETAFTMVITAFALVAGLLIANVVAPGRKIG